MSQYPHDHEWHYGDMVKKIYWNGNSPSLHVPRFCSTCFVYEEKELTEKNDN